ncbi:MAG: 3'(2'),5'-bisphosphate nucleotidase CysQ [Caulobacteraceae bacterium]|nr:3'(2'),5'-bisphosphate nucleotidase CysQ [Caulobacteraceae bacterium]
MKQDQVQELELGARLAQIVEVASGVILPLWRSGVTVDVKSDDSPVTEADRRAEVLILAALAESFPDIPVIAEEASAANGVPLTIARRFFLVDPLDGTKAFVRGEAHFTVNIGLIEDGVPVAGAVACPPTGEVWFTGPGGAFKRQFGETAGAPIHVRPRGETVVALSSHTLKPEQSDVLKAQYGFTERRAMDSSIKLCVIAEGGADLYPRHGTTMEWDIAAGHAVLAAAGGGLTTPEGEPFLYGKSEAGFKNGWFVARGG